MRSFIILVAAACAIIDLACTTQTDVLFNQGGPYQRSVQVIFNRSCNRGDCHATRRSPDSLSLATYADVMIGSKDGHIVVPFNPEHSDLFLHINRDTTIAGIASPTMPPDTSTLQPLTQADRDTIRQWIANGCKADDGSSPYTVYPMGRVFVTNQSEDLVAVIDIATQQVVRYAHAGVTNTLLAPPKVPHNVTMDRQGRFFYTTLVAANELWQFDPQTLLPVKTVNVGSSPAHVVVNATGDTAYVTNWDVTTRTARSVTVVNTASMKVTDTIYDQRMIAPHGERLSSDGHYLYTANEYGDNVSKIDVWSKKVVAVIPLAADVPLFPADNYEPVYKPFQVAVTDSFVYVTCYASNDVRVIQRSLDSVVTVIPVGKGPIQLRTTPDGSKILVANRDDSSVTVINTISNAVAMTIHNIGVQPHGVDITADGRYAYVSCESQTGSFRHHPLVGSRSPGTTAVIDMRTLNQTQPTITTIEMGSFPAGVAIEGRGD